MDVLNPELKWIEDRCYRVLRIQDSLRSTEEDDVQSSICNQEGDAYDSDLPIVHQGNLFYISIYIPGPLFRNIFGYKGRKIHQYSAKVNIPFNNNTTSEITISGSTTDVVSETYHKIKDSVRYLRLKKKATHFVSLPVNLSEIKTSFLKFKSEVLAKYNGVRGVDESIFQNPNKLHVTIACLVLLDKRDEQNAIALLKSCTDNILIQLGIKKFIVQIKGLEYMNDDPAEVDVLYAKLKEVNDDNCLQIIADSIMKKFIDENFSKFEQDKVKLHITIMNTLFRGKDNTVNRITFDARPILKDYSDYDFGQMIVSEIHLSVRHSVAPDGYYTAIQKLNLIS